MKLSQSKKALIVTCGLLWLTGCTTINPYTGERQVSDSTIGTGVGAAGGALVGALVDGGRGAVIGGALGALTGGFIGQSFDAENEELRRALVGTGVQVIKVNGTIQLVMAADVTFATNHADIRYDFYPTLSSVATVLRKYNKTNITITGFTDNVGGDAYNQELSEARARSVGAYLMSQGVSPNRIFTRGMGKRAPIASNASPGGRALNRRVVITLRPLG